MIICLKVDDMKISQMQDMVDNKEVKIKGVAQGIYFKDAYFNEVQEKARKYDEIVDAAKMISKNIDL